MKNLLLVGAALVSFLAVAEDSPRVKQFTPEQRAQMVARRHELRTVPRAELIRREGGLLYQAPTGNVIRIINAQKATGIEGLEPMRDGFKVAMGLSVMPPVAVEAQGIFDAVKKGFAIPKTGAVLAFVDDTDAPPILCAPEKAWAAINVRPLMADKPDKKTLDTRILKEAWRALAMALGAADSLYRPCLLAPTYSLADLDKNPSLVVCPEPFNFIAQNARRLGISKVYERTYLYACREGWAPAPSNDVQRAIWDKVHALPTKPIVIAPEK